MSSEETCFIVFSQTRRAGSKDIARENTRKFHILIFKIQNMYIITSFFQKSKEISKKIDKKTETLKNCIVQCFNANAFFCIFPLFCLICSIFMLLYCRDVNK